MSDNIRNLVSVPYENEGEGDATLYSDFTPQTISRRVQLTSTIKDGFRVGEVSVTLSGTYEEDNLEADYATIARELEGLATIGNMAASKLNSGRSEEIIVSIKGKND